MLGKATSNIKIFSSTSWVSFVAHGDAAPSCFGGLWPSTWWGNGATLNKGPGMGNEFRHPNGAPRSMEIWFLVSFALGLKRQCQTYCKTTTFVASWTKPRATQQFNIWNSLTAQIGVGSYDPGVPWCITTLEFLHSTVKEPGAPYMRETPTWSMAIKCSRQIRNGTELLPWQGPRHCSVVGHCQVVAAKPAIRGMKFDIPFDIGIYCCKKFCHWSKVISFFGGTTTDHYYCSVRRPNKSHSVNIQK